ncbi:MAG: nucleotidyltransferase domain-containing protein [Deltaproteobacteria bacterium]|nr:nucleotidyltransferase domain-containing protein [Deltaproteobacteria bacterium]
MASHHHGLTPEQVEIIRDILRPFGSHIERVCLFGSRATGTYRNNSDIDIVLDGDVNEAMLDRIWTLFDASDLPVSVDVTAYKMVDYPPLKAHIDQVMVLLFSREEIQ